MELDTLDTLYNVTISIDHEIESTKDISPQVVYGIAAPIGLLASSLLLAWLFFFRSPRHPFFVVLANWALVNLFHVVIRTISTFASSTSWTLGRVWCQLSQYLLMSLSYTRPYLIVLATLLTLIGNQRFNRWTGPRTWVKILTPCLACLSVWMLTLLPGIWYWDRVRFQVIDSMGWNEEVLQVCYLEIENHSTGRVNLFVMVLLPLLLTVAFLLGWACLQRGSKMADPVEKVQVCVLFSVLHISLITQFPDQVLVYFIIPTSASIEIFRMAAFLSIAGYAVSPTLCLIIIAAYRKTLLQSKAAKRNATREENAEEMSDLTKA